MHRRGLIEIAEIVLPVPRLKGRYGIARTALLALFPSYDMRDHLLTNAG